MPQKADGKSGKEPITFTRLAAERIARAVRKSEHGPREAAPFGFGVRLQSFGGGKAFRMATFTDSWSKGSSKTVVFLNQTNTPNTATAINLFANVDVATAVTAHCAIARDGTAWYLIAAECDAGEEEE
jgi:hypothetical protein